MFCVKKEQLQLQVSNICHINNIFRTRLSPMYCVNLAETSHTHRSIINVCLNPIRSGLFQTVNDPGGSFKSPPLGSRKLLCQSSPYHTCEFYQVFLA